MEAEDPRVAVVTALREAVSYGNVDGVRAALDSPYGADLLESRLVRRSTPLMRTHAAPVPPGSLSRLAQA